MTRKDYVAIAAAFKWTHPGAVLEGSSGIERRLTQWAFDVRKVADVLHADNPRFDRIRFYEACGYDWNILA